MTSSIRSYFVAIGLVALVLLAFGPALQNGFVLYDDPGYVTQNPNVQGGLSAEGIVWAFTTTAQGNWHPLTWLSHMIDVSLFGTDPGAHHRTSLLLHALNAVLLFLFLRAATGATWRSGIVAALFATHPLRVESVAWVSERKDVLSAAFGFAALNAYVKYARRPSFPKWVAVSTGLCLGLLSKPMLVTLPLLMLLMDYWPLGRLRPRAGPSGIPSQALVREKIPWIALSVASGAVTLLAQAGGGAVRTFETVRPAARLANAAQSYVDYLVQTLWPADLAFLYPYPTSFDPARVIASSLAVALLSWLAWRYRHRAPYAVFGWGWYVIMLLPVIGLVQVGMQARADRYTYLPSAGVFVLIVWGIASWVARAPRLRPAFAVAVFSALAATVVATRAQVMVWKDSLSLFGRAIEVTRHNHVAHELLGVALKESGRTEEAVAQYREALRLRPDYASARVNLGAALADLGRLDEAVAEYEAAIAADPSLSKAHNNLGVALARLGRTAEAVRRFEMALALAPEDPEVHANLAIALAAAGDEESALEHFRDAIRLRPSWVEGANAAAWILATHPDPELRDGAEAVGLAEGACRATAYGEPRFLETLAAAYAESRRFADAVRAADRALDRAESRGDAAAAERLKEQAALYRAGRPSRRAPDQALLDPPR